MHKNIGSFLAFNEEWFRKHQVFLLRLLANRWTGKLSRWVLCIRKGDIGYQGHIIAIGPSYYTVFLRRIKKKKIEVATDFRTHPKYAKRIYYAFMPLWWFCHLWDVFADPLFPHLSFGFSTLTQFPDAGTGATTVDGWMSDSGAVWSTVHSDVNGTDANPSLDGTAATAVQCSLFGGTYFLRRIITLFDTSAIGSSTTITSAIYSQYINLNGSGSADSMSNHLVSSTPASNNNLVVGDYSQVGTTSYGNYSLPGSLNAYNDIIINSTGLAQISKTGITKFGSITSGDLNNSAPTALNQVQVSMADVAGTSQDPKLVVTYTVSLTMTTPNTSISIKDTMIAY